MVLDPVESEYAIVYEDPDNIDAPSIVTIPAPSWVAAALAGGILPDIKHWHADQKIKDEYLKKHGSLAGFSWKEQGGLSYPYGEPVGPMNMREMIEYILQKDIDPKIWRDYKGNRQILKIVHVNDLPKDQTFRDAWKIIQNGVEIAA